MNYSVTDTQLTGIADAIRAKSGGTASLTFPTGFNNAISGIKTPSDIGLTKALETMSSSVSAQTIPSGGYLYVDFSYILTNTPVGTYTLSATGNIPNGFVLKNSSDSRNGKNITATDVYQNATASSITVTARTCAKAITYYYE